MRWSFLGHVFLELISTNANLGYNSTIVKLLGIHYCICASGNLVFLGVRNILSEFPVYGKFQSLTGISSPTLYLFLVRFPEIWSMTCLLSTLLKRFAFFFFPTWFIWLDGRCKKVFLSLGKYLTFYLILLFCVT